MFLFDCGLGLLLTVAIAAVAGLEPSLWLLLSGLAGSLLPDWDMLPHLIRKRGKLDQWAHKHRDISHYPLVTIPLCGVTVVYCFGLWYGVVVAVTVTAHYLADSFEFGWGIRWLYPFSKRYYAYRTGKTSEKRFRAWTPAQQDEMARQFGNPDWVKEKSRWRFDVVVLILGIGAALCWYFAL